MNLVSQKVDIQVLSNDKFYYCIYLTVYFLHVAVPILFILWFSSFSQYLQLPVFTFYMGYVMWLFAVAAIYFFNFEWEIFLTTDWAPLY